MTSFSGEVDARPDYSQLVDIVGTQSRGSDTTSNIETYNRLVKYSKGSDREVWCTMCSQTWLRNAEYNQSSSYDWRLAYQPSIASLHSDDTKSRLQSGYESFDANKYWRQYFAYTPTTTPASIALTAGLTGFVAEHAIPRFISTYGELRKDINWSADDYIVDSDSNRKRFTND